MKNYFAKASAVLGIAAIPIAGLFVGNGCTKKNYVCEKRFYGDFSSTLLECRISGPDGDSIKRFIDEGMDGFVDMVYSYPKNERIFIYRQFTSAEELKNRANGGFTLESNNSFRAEELQKEFDQVKQKAEAK